MLEIRVVTNASNGKDYKYDFANDSVNRVERTKEIMDRHNDIIEVIYKDAPLKPIEVCIDDEDNSFKGMTYGQHWNGWECPLFTYEVMLEIMKDWNYQLNYDLVTYDKDKDIFKIWDKDYGDEEDEEDTYISEPSIIDDVKYYSMGYCFIWTKVER